MKCNLAYDRDNKKFYIIEPIGQDLGNGVMGVWSKRIVDVTEEILEFLKKEINPFNP